jgi:hypothetical protein
MDSIRRKRRPFRLPACEDCYRELFCKVHLRTRHHHSPSLGRKGVDNTLSLKGARGWGLDGVGLAVPMPWIPNGEISSFPICLNFLMGPLPGSCPLEGHLLKAPAYLPSQELSWLKAAPAYYQRMAWGRAARPLPEQASRCELSEGTGHGFATEVSGASI